MLVVVCVFLAHSSREDDDAQHIHAITGSRPGTHHNIRRRCQVKLEVSDIAAILTAATVILEIVYECATRHTRALSCPWFLHHRYAVSAVLGHTRAQAQVNNL